MRGITDVAFQQAGKQNSDRHLLNSFENIDDSSGEHFCKMITGMLSGPQAVEEPKIQQISVDDLIKEFQKKYIEIMILSFSENNCTQRYSKGIQRHLASKTHQNAAEIEKRKPKEDRIKNVQNVPAQTSISSNIEKASHDAYQKLINTAYKLAVNPTISLNCFSVLVEIQKENSIPIVSGTSDGRAAKKFIRSIYSAVLEKSNLILNQSHFYSILPDGSQARKTGVDKELVLLKTTLKGSPVTMFAHLIDCNDYGGTDAAFLKLGIDSIFDEDGPLPCAAFREKLISCTADGANANTGHKEGLQKKLCRDGDRPWLVPIRCINHLVELAVKDAFFESSFKDVDRLYENIFSLCKSSGVVKSEITKAAEMLNISYYAFPKLKGTRFIPHSRTSISSLINMWPAVIMALENNMSSKKGKKDTKNVFEKVSPLSKVFEDDGQGFASKGLLSNPYWIKL
ncbi:uncharacterized protein LOC136088170 [Hydra vulgaris]|uniref:Uncharacterized protein LOC136088170 n=1 Tax=Hydra vulgaris TaxID=6087 RepID=A0ABM4D114_HYDVU